MIKHQLNLVVTLVVFQAISLFGDADDSRFEQSEKQIQTIISHQNSAEKDVRDKMLELAPLGSSPEQIKNLIGKTLQITAPVNYKKNFYTSSPYSHDLMYVAGSIGVILSNTPPQLLKADDLVGSKTVVVWYFDEKDSLINVVVNQYPTGP